jgi:hypothetical protein
LKLNGTHQLLVYADAVNILGRSVHTVKENAEALLVGSKRTGLEVHADKSKYMVMSGNRNAGRSQNIKMIIAPLKRWNCFKYLGTNLANKDSIQEEIQSRLKSGNVCCHSVQNFLSSRLLFKNTKMKIHGTTILSSVVDGCETWSFALREERKLSLFKNRVLRRIFGRVYRGYRKLLNEELNNLHRSPNIIRVIKSRRMR